MGGDAYDGEQNYDHYAAAMLGWAAGQSHRGLFANLLTGNCGLSAHSDGVACATGHQYLIWGPGRRM